VYVDVRCSGLISRLISTFEQSNGWFLRQLVAYTDRILHEKFLPLRTIQLVAYWGVVGGPLGAGLPKRMSWWFTGQLGDVQDRWGSGAGSHTNRCVGGTI